MFKKILFFTAGDSPTEAEAAQLAALNALAAQPYTVQVLNGRPRVKRAATTLSFATADKSANDSGNGFLTAGFKPGDVVTIRGVKVATGCNLVGVTIATVTAGKMTFVGTSGNAITTRAAGDSVVIETVGTALYSDGIPMPGDFIAGTYPASYVEDGDPIYPIFDVDNPPDAPTLPATQTVLSNGETVDLDDDAGSVDFTVADGEITGAALSLPATAVIVTHTQVIPVTGGGSVALTIAAGAITGCAYTAP